MPKVGKGVPPDATKFKKGQSGNPSGKPKGVLNAATRMKRFLLIEMESENPISNEKERLSVAERMDLEIISKALKGDIVAWDKINDRLEGKAPSSLDITSDGQQIGDAWSGLPPAKKAEILRIMNSENASSE